MTGLALSNLWVRRARTGLAALAVAVEVTLVLLLVGLTTGTLREVGDRIENVRADILLLPPGAQLILSMSTAVMPLEPVAAAIEHLEGVQAAAPVVIASTNRFGSYAMIFGIDPRSYAAAGRGNLTLVEGDNMEGPDDVLVDSRLARARGLKPGDPARLLDHDFRIAGIVREGAGARIYAPIATMQDLLGRQEKASAFFIRTASPEHTRRALEAIRQQPSFQGYRAIATSDYGEMLGSSTFGVREFIAAVTVVSTAFGFLVISLAMYTTIIERTRDIGILKSLGASNRFIVASVLLEAGLLCLLGIPLGIALAWLGRAALQASYPTLIIFLTGRWMGYAALLALGGGLLGSLYPALRAASVDPVVALSEEAP